ncbi:MAG TPA: DUF5017 domain-containing protein [Bacteroidetes bacterium]|nr:DUF5017 domain-containing protein [Bacteroidota bacterium]
MKDKMKIMKDIRYITGIFLTTILFLNGCVDKFDEEPPFTPIEYGSIVPISQVKDLYREELSKPWYERTPVQITEDWAITGVVIGSDKVNGNLYKEGYLEDASGGILLKFLSTGGFYLGDSVIIHVKDLYLGDYGNFIQLGDVPYTDNSGNYRVSGFNKDRRMVKVSINHSFSPAQVGIQQVKNDQYPGRLVQFHGVQFASYELGKTWADPLADPPAAANRYLEDCDGNQIIVRTSGYASFAGDPLPEGNGSVTGIVTVFNDDYQLIIRDFAEVLLDGERCIQNAQELGTPVETLSEDFESFSDDEDILIDGWQNLMIVGNRLWRNQVYSGNSYAQATGYGSGLEYLEIWLITRPVTISTQKVLTFQSAQAYWEHEPGNHPLEVLVSADYNGTNFYSATWVPLSGTLADSSTPAHAFVSSGNIDLPVAAGQNAVIAFKYTGSATESTSYRLDNVNITTGK